VQRTLVLDPDEQLIGPWAEHRDAVVLEPEAKGRRDGHFVDRIRRLGHLTLQRRVALFFGKYSAGSCPSSCAEAERLDPVAAAPRIALCRWHEVVDCALDDRAERVEVGVYRGP
jgi:hypothetical protein